MNRVKEIKNEYNEFIVSIPMLIIHLKKILKKDELSYQLVEIEQVEDLYKKNYENPEVLEISKDKLDKIVLCYFGVAFMWHFGGNWCLNTLEDTETYGEAEIENWGGTNYKDWCYMSPKSWIWYIESNQLDDNISDLFKRKMWYFKNNPQFILSPVRNIK